MNTDDHEMAAAGGGQTADAENRTLIKPDHNQRRALVWVDGLSVFAFNRTKGCAEFGFVREEHSPVEIRLYRNDEPQAFWTTKGDFPFPTENIRITVNSTKPGLIGSRYEDGQNPPVDGEDFRNMLSLAGLYGVPVLQSKPDPFDNILTARLYVYDATLFTYQLSQNKAKILEKQGGVTRTIDEKRVGRITGGDIICAADEDLVIQITRKGVDEAFLLPLLSGPDQYEIVIRTEPQNDRDHFHHIRELYEMPVGDPRLFDLRFDPPEPAFRTRDDVTFRVGQFACENTGEGTGNW